MVWVRKTTSYIHSKYKNIITQQSYLTTKNSLPMCLKTLTATWRLYITVLHRSFCRHIPIGGHIGATTIHGHGTSVSADGASDGMTLGMSVRHGHGAGDPPGVLAGTGDLLGVGDTVRAGVSAGTMAGGVLMPHGVQTATVLYAPVLDGLVPAITATVRPQAPAATAIPVPNGVLVAIIVAVMVRATQTMAMAATA